MEQKKLLEISDELLDLLLDFKKDNPDFTFSLRERDSPQAKDVKRLEKGQWFQGSNYIYVPLFRKGDNARKIKTIGFVVGSNREGEQTNYIEVSFKKGDFTNEEISFHKELSEIFDIKLNNENVGYFQFDDPKNYIENLSFYLNEFRTTAFELLKSYKLEDRFLITEDNFQKRLKKIYEIKKVLGDPSYSVNNRNTIIKESDENIMKQPLNQILYGPPGTGKTYNTINKAIEIANPKFNTNEELDEKAERKAINEEYKRLVNEGQIVFTTFHQSMTYEDFIEGIKPLKPEADDEFVKYDIRNGILKTVCEKATHIEVSEDNFETAFQKLISEIEKSPTKNLILETLVHSKEFTVYKNSKGNLKFHANTEKAYEGVIRKDVIEHYLKTGEALDWPSYTKAVAQYLVEKFNYNKVLKAVEQKNYVLIIDEINRGNVSQIFGELITLIEEDKRLSNDEAIEVTLPYSKEKFGVPSNLYIIGTMNTADRSVEALDTALRRRFVFEEIPPKYNLDGLQQELFGFKAADILETINLRIEKLLDRDHQIGHAYFINKNETTIIDSFYKNIIPLLQEYFFGDYGKIGLVLGSGFVRKLEQEAVFAQFEHIDYSQFEEKESYEIIDHRTHLTGFGEAIQRLMNR
ncbi:AAA family ATPase [Empedobacter falsenii]|uniref:AAA family ATPase n=1 Tax=Empedobacter falsenii TaxID=343874 RepID=A0ABY8V8E0_9FLAO|nr:AAA family ATPase [Empedobacter falsenii]WIH97402.1 AAA family ATPase [Empedobacter falsenii]